MTDLFGTLTRLENLPLLGFAVVLLALYLLLRARSRVSNRTIVVDGSNVLYWKNNVPDIGAVAELVALLRQMGVFPVVYFDANVGYLVADRYLGDAQMARLINLPARRVVVVTKGIPADPELLTAAGKLGARVVSNDRFRDWADAFPAIGTAGFLVRGHYRRGQLVVDLAKD